MHTFLPNLTTILVFVANQDSIFPSFSNCATIAQVLKSWLGLQKSAINASKGVADGWMCGGASDGGVSNPVAGSMIFTGELLRAGKHLRLECALRMRVSRWFDGGGCQLYILAVAFAATNEVLRGNGKEEDPLAIIAPSTVVISTLIEIVDNII